MSRAWTLFQMKCARFGTQAAAGKAAVNGILYPTSSERSSDRRPLSVGIGPASVGTGVGNPELSAPGRALRHCRCTCDPWRTTPSIRTNLVFGRDTGEGGICPGHSLSQKTSRIEAWNDAERVRHDPRYAGLSAAQRLQITAPLRMAPWPALVVRGDR